MCAKDEGVLPNLPSTQTHILTSKCDLNTNFGLQRNLQAAWQGQIRIHPYPKWNFSVNRFSIKIQKLHTPIRSLLHGTFCQPNCCCHGDEVILFLQAEDLSQDTSVLHVEGSVQRYVGVKFEGQHKGLTLLS